MAKTTKETPTKTNQYEGMFLFGSGAATEPQAAENLVRKFIEQHGGEVLVLKKWDERKLAYEIRQRNEADYRYFRFQSEPALLDRLDHSLKIADGVLRFRIFRVDHDTPSNPPPATERPAMVGDGRGDRGDRERRPRRDDRDE